MYRIQRKTTLKCNFTSRLIQDMYYSDSTRPATKYTSATPKNNDLAKSSSLGGGIVPKSVNDLAQVGLPRMQES